jgi:hypothetical protein
MAAGKKKLLTETEMAALLGEWRRLPLSMHTLANWRQAGRVPHMKVGRAVLYDPDEMRAWFDAQHVPAKAPS